MPSFFCRDGVWQIFCPGWPGTTVLLISASCTAGWQASTASLGCMFFSFFLFLVGLGFELRLVCLQSRHTTTWATPPIQFSLVVLEMGVSQIICWAGLLLSASQVARIGLCYWHPAVFLNKEAPTLFTRHTFQNPHCMLHMLCYPMHTY
jgi:hypothetical protein